MCRPNCKLFSFSARRKRWIAINRQEMEAFIGLLLLLGAFRAKYREVNELWSLRDGFSACRATMTMERFLQIKRVLRCDDPLRRNREDPLAPIRYVHESFNAKLRKAYIPCEWLTIDEQLLEFHGRVKMKQYISSKPGKFGLKLFWICDAESSYALNSVIYVGEGTLNPGEKVTAKAVTMHLMEPFLDSGRHLTGDNWFSSVELAHELEHRRTTYIGTIRKNNRSVPKVALETRERRRKDTRVFYDETGLALVSFWDKGSSPVLLIDTLHRSVPTPQEGTKCISVLEYNRTKSGVDISDKRTRSFSCKRKCRRWPFAIMANMIDIAGNNACIIFNETSSSSGARRQQQHYTFLKNAGYQLIGPHVQHRLDNGFLNPTILQAMKNIGYEPTRTLPSAERLQKSKRCVYCSRSRDRKTFFICPKCKSPRCSDHQSPLCMNCSDN